MNNTISYLNTDLDLISAEDLTVLAAAFEAGGVPALHDVLRWEDGKWHASFETHEQHTEPETNIAAMLTVIESLTPALRLVWASCSKREFNVGYDCGLQPWAFNQALSTELLGRMAAVGASLGFTLYPDLDQHRPNQPARPTE